MMNPLIHEPNTHNGHTKGSFLLSSRLVWASSSLLVALSVSSPASFATPPSTPAVTPKLQPTHIDVQEVKSPKGITAWMVESHEIPVVSIALAFKNAGMASDPKGLAGLVNLLSGLLDEGAGEWSGQEFKKFLLEKNIELSITANQDTFQISFRTIKQNAKDAFFALRTILSKPRFDLDALNRVKNQIATILEQSLHNEHAIASQKMNSLLYGTHPYGKTTEQTLQEYPKVTPDQLRQFMKERFAQDQILISVVGDITPNELTVFLDETFGVLPEKAIPLKIDDASTLNKGTTELVPLDIPQSVIYFSQPGIARCHPDFYAAFVLMKILGDGQFESRLWNEIREKRGLAYGVNAHLSWLRHSSLITGGTATKSENVADVIAIIRNVWQKALQGITKKELDFVKERMIGSFALNFSSTLKIAGALLTYQIDDLGLDFINKRNEMIASLTKEQLDTIAKSLLKPEELTFVIVGKPEGLSLTPQGQESTPKATQK